MAYAALADHPKWFNFQSFSLILGNNFYFFVTTCVINSGLRSVLSVFTAKW